MSRDGLLPKLFSDVHKSFRTPWKSNVMLMVFVSLFSAFLPISTLGELTSIGTLFAFVVVCIGVVIMRRTQPDLPRPYKTPFVPLFPILGVLANFLLMVSLKNLTWIIFLGWMGFGLLIYFTYSRANSKLTAAR
jgi:APA family basic amino acid/polyamine antiporter